MPTAISLRERKKQRTRTSIQQAALELFARDGYRDTTIAAIAEAADVAPRTVTVHFPTKEDLLFAADPFAIETLTARIQNRSDEESTLDALHDWMATTMSDLSSETPETQKRVWHQRQLRAHVINSDDTLRARARTGYYEYEQVIAIGLGQDLDQPADSLVPRLAAITAVAGLRELYESREIRGRKTPPSTAELLAWVDRVIDFIRAGIASLEDSPPQKHGQVPPPRASRSAAQRKQH
jgi:AcrR family transcriptional regulator